MIRITPDPKLDLVLERVVDVPPDLVWEAWTTPKHLVHWFVPKPWTTTACDLDLRPGGHFRTVMRSPEGQEFPNVGCYLEIVPRKRLVWTDALQPGFRPALAATSCLPNFMTAIIELEPHGRNGTRYTATALHGDAEGRKKHEEMGFHEGWGTCLDQLVAYVKAL
jgi:uncharacterized protein YndB with AHSA1/START domain